MSSEGSEGWTTGAGNSLTAERVLQTLFVQRQRIQAETFTVSVGVLNHPTFCNWGFLNFVHETVTMVTFGCHMVIPGRWYSFQAARKKLAIG